MDLINCPDCKSNSSLKEVLYGLPDGPIDEGKFVIGGCCISDRDPEVVCTSCGWEVSCINNIELLNNGNL
jgi:hypothetical protein